MKTVAHNTAFLTGASIIQKALSFLYFIVLSRAFGASGIGAYTYALSFTTIFAIIVDGGVTPVLIREIAAHPAAAAHTLRRALQCKAILFFLALLAMLSVGFFLDAARTLWPLIAIAGVVMTFDSLNLTLYGVLRGFHTVQLESLGLLVAQTIAIIFGLCAVVFHAPIAIAIIGLGAASITNSLLSGRAVFKMLRTITQPVISKLTIKEFIREAIPFGLAGAFARGYSYLDALIIGEQVSVAAVGLYSIANKLTFAFQFVPLALSASLYPAFAKELSERTHETPEKLRGLWNNAQRYVIFVGTGIVVGLVVLAKNLLHLYGNSFGEAHIVLTILALSLVASFISYPTGALLNAAKLQHLQTTAMGVTFAINAILNLLLIPRVGIVGAACAAWIGNMCLASVGAYYAHQRVVKLPWVSFTKNLMIAVCAGICGAFVLYGLRVILPWMIAGIGGIIMYAALLIVFGGVSTAECKGLFARLLRI